MTQNTFCAGAEAPVVAQHYVAKNMSRAEREAYENHFVACAVCQDEVRVATILRNSLSAADGIAPRSLSRAIPRSRVLFATGTLLAAGIAAIAIVRANGSPDLTSLGGLSTPPGYLGESVRGAASQGDSLFERAMSAYAARRYPDAAAGLTAALAAGQDSIPTEFFLGASLLMSNDASAAADRFAHVIAKGASPYLDEAQFYEAKALLRLGRARDALTVLNNRTPANGKIAGMVKGLSDSVTSALPR